MKNWTTATMMLVLGACTPGNGEGLDGNGRPIGETPPVGGTPGATYKQIQDDVFTPACTVCHAGAAAPVGLRLDTASSFAQLVGVASVQVPGLLRVDPGNPDASYLVQKLEGTATVGERMPVGAAPVDAALIAQIRSWIGDGALPDPPGTATPVAPKVAAVVPADASTLTAAPAQISVVFDSAMDATLFGTTTVLLEASGGDGSFTEGNETAVVTGAIGAPAGNDVTLNVALSGVALGDDTYRLTLKGSGTLFLASLEGIALDGNGDGAGGDDFTSTFALDTFVAPPPDVTAPVLSIAAPPGPLQGVVTLSVTALDDVGVTAVRLAAAGQSLGALNAAPYEFAWDTTTLANGDYVLTAQADDAAGNTGDAPAVTVTVANPPPPDTTPPSVALDALAATVAGAVTVSATATDDTAVARVRFIVDDQLLAIDETEPYSFVWTTTNFTEGPHTLRAEAEDLAGNVAPSADVTVSVDNVPEADLIPPAVAIDPPGDPLSGTVNISVSASDNVGVIAVRLFADGAPLGTDTTAPFAFAWDTTAVDDGSVILTAEADDAAGNTGSAAAVTVNVDNVPPPDTQMPTVSIDALSGPLSGTVNVGVTATDNVAVTAVRLFVDGAVLATDTAEPFAFDWDTTAVADGDRMLRAEADDAAGNTGVSAVVTVTVDNAPPGDTQAPTVTIQAPAGALAGTAIVSVVASDDTGVSAVSLFVDGALVATIGTAPFDFPVVTTALAEGNHVLAAYADDAAANRGYASPVVAAVDNGVPQPTLPWIQENVFDVSCAFGGCHGPPEQAGLLLTDGQSFAELVNAPTEEGGAPLRAVPGEPDNSSLVQRLEGTIAGEAQMPLGAGPLDPALIAAVRDWIANGATQFPADTIAPAITLVLPSSPASGTVSLSAQAVDDVAVTAVRFLVNNVEIGSAFSTPYALFFDTSTLANGPAAVVALAEDAAGNSTQSAVQTLVIENN